MSSAEGFGLSSIEALPFWSSFIMETLSSVSAAQGQARQNPSKALGFTERSGVAHRIARRPE
jgi:hypothetical protein